MTEKPGQYSRDDGRPFNSPKSSAETLAKSFAEGIQAFHWKADFVKFCEVLGLDADHSMVNSRVRSLTRTIAKQKKEE